MFFRRFPLYLSLLVLLSVLALTSLQPIAAQTGDTTGDAPMTTPPRKGGNGNCEAVFSQQTVAPASVANYDNLGAAVSVEPPQSLGAMLNADGTLNLSTKFSGALDTTGWRMTTDATGAPRFVPANGTTPGDEQWDGRFQEPGLGRWLFDEVYALASDGTDIYIGGAFDTIGNNVVVNNLVRWDGKQFHALGSGVNGVVAALHVHEGRLYVGGEFTQAGTITANGLARWDQQSQQWSQVGNGSGPNLTGSYLDPFISAITSVGDELYVGGRFTSVDAVPAWGVARFNLTTKVWSSLGCGLGANSYTISAGTTNVLMKGSNNKVYVGGNFQLAINSDGSTLTVAGIVEWNPSTQRWATMGTLPTCPCTTVVTAIAQQAQVLYIAATMVNRDYQRSYAINRWDADTQQWSQIASQITSQVGSNDDPIYQMVILHNSLYVGGKFEGIGGTVAKNFARYQFSNGQWAPALTSMIDESLVCGKKASKNRFVTTMGGDALG